MAIVINTLLHKRYRIIGVLGQGGMGSIYRAMDESLGVEVAVKENLFTTEEYARQFHIEAVIMAKLRHPNLPRVTDHFVINGQGQYLVMDYIEGEDLRQRMEHQGSISEEETIVIGAAICDALAYLHTRKPPILHRDIKPGNVKITPEGHVFLVDFGLVKEMNGDQLTATGARAMTPGYSPPEQYGSARTDVRTDIYSLAATLYASLTGIIPEDGLARLMDDVVLTPIRKHNPKVSPQLAQVIEKAMASKADERFQTADEFKQALLSSNVKTQHLDGLYLANRPPQSEKTKQIKEPLEKPITAQVVEMSGTPVKPAKKQLGVGFWVFLSSFSLLLSLCLFCVIGGLLTSDSLPNIVNTIMGKSTTTTVISSSTSTETLTPGYRMTSTPTNTATSTPSPTPTKRVNPPTLTKTPESTNPPPPPPVPTFTPTLPGIGP